MNANNLKTSLIIAMAAIAIVLIIGVLVIVALGKQDNLTAMMIAIVPTISTIISLFGVHQSASYTQQAVADSGLTITRTINGGLEAAIKKAVEQCLPLTSSIDPATGTPVYRFPPGMTLEDVVKQWQASQAPTT